MKPWIKFVLAFLSLPFVLAQGWVLADLAALWWPAGEWHSGWFLSFTAGFVIWLLLYFCLPRLLWIYVLGHELTHALAVYLAGGRVFDFKVSAGGGHVKTDKVNWWITLSPYFIPLYSLLWLGLWVSVDFYYPLDAYRALLFGGLGFTWGFHVCFTLSMIHLNQTDIRSQGCLFSTVIILFCNLLLLQLFFIAAARTITWNDWAGQELKRSKEVYVNLGKAVRSAFRELEDLRNPKPS